jgi:hypothetical protein
VNLVTLSLGHPAQKDETNLTTCEIHQWSTLYGRSWHPAPGHHSEEHYRLLLWRGIPFGKALPSC